MKIAVIASLYKPYSRGGAEVITEAVIQELKKEHDVFVITISPWKGLTSLYPKRDSENGIGVYRFYPLNIFSFIDINKKSFFLRIFWHMVDMINMHSAWVVHRILAKEKPHLVLTHTLKGIGYTIPWMIKKMRIPHIHTVHDVQCVVPSGQMMLGAEHALQISFFLKIYRSVTRKIIDSPQCVICPSRFLKEFYDAYGFFQASKKVVLQNPVAQFVDAGIAQKTKKNITYLYLGQLEEHKGIVFLLHIFMSWNDPDVRFVIAGAGSREMDAVLAAEKDSRISYYGYCAEEKKEQLFSDVHFLVVPSLCYENAPAVISESFTHGVPVIVAKIGGAHELVEDKKNGFLFTAGDAQSAKDALVLTKNSIDRYEDLSENARAGIRHNTTQEYCKKMLILTHSELRGA